MRRSRSRYGSPYLKVRSRSRLIRAARLARARNAVRLCGRRADGFPPDGYSKTDRPASPSRHAASVAADRLVGRTFAIAWLARLGWATVALVD